MPTIYRKSAKGVSEIETRAHKLPPRLRSALILVDGKRTESELRAMLGAQAEETLTALSTEGFIEVSAEAMARKTAAASAPVAVGVFASTAGATGPSTLPPAAPVTLPMSVPPSELGNRKRDAVRAVNDLLGPMGESLSIRIEKARTGEELRQVLESALPVIVSARGREEATKFAARFSDL